MSDDKIAEIRARHEAGPIGHLPIAAFSLADDDRGFLLAEVERLRADNEQLTRERDEARAEVERMQELLRGISINMVDLIEQLTRERDTLQAENERLRAEIDGLEAELALMKSVFEIAYRAMGEKP